MLIVNLIIEGGGWNPINHMVALAAELLEAEVVHVNERVPTSLQRLFSILHKRASAGRHASETCLFVCAGPTDLLQVLNIDQWRSRFSFLAAWVIDSFWVDWIPRSIRISKPFDHFFVTSGEDVQQWAELTGVPVTWLPWGTDALRLGTGSSNRNWDMTRIGRQPPEWNDDAVTAVDAARAKMRFHPRLSDEGVTPLQNQRLLMRLYGDTKFLLAFSNIASPAKNTHPKRQYLTGRWVDALAGGAVVAGVPPREPSIDQLLWPEALLDLGTVERAPGMKMIEQALQRWTPKTAETNYRRALERLDWRWRFKVLADAFEQEAKPLRADLNLLAEKLGQATTA